MFFLYEVVIHLVFILLLPFFLVAGFLRGKYLTNVRDRFARFSYGASEHDVWIHAVSVGEVMAAKTIVDHLRRQKPELSGVITTTTITGQQMARRLFAGWTVTYFPFDFSHAVRRFIDHHRPRTLILVETEIWPNVSRICRERGIPVLLTNGRISDRSFPRYRAMRRLVGGVIGGYEGFLVREDVDRERFIAIGAAPEKVRVVGNIKFDFVPDPTPLEIADDLGRAIAGRPVCVFGSTVEGEDELIMPIVEQLVRDRGAFVVIAPRKPERFEFVAGLLAASNMTFARRSEWGSRPAAFDVLLLDSIGELARMYRMADAAFVGGSLIAGTGGHNPIEPAAAGAPVAFGTHMSNFREIAREFLRSGAATEVSDVDELQRFFEAMLDSPAERKAKSSLAAETVRRNQGAASRTAAAIMELVA